MKIKRTMLCFGTVFCVFAMFSIFAEINTMIALSVALSAAGICFLFGKNSRKPLIFILAALFGVLAVLRFNIFVSAPLEKLSGRKIKIQGIITNETNYGRMTFLKCRVTVPNSKGIPKSFLCELRCFNDNHGHEGDCFSAVVNTDLNSKKQIVENFSDGISLTALIKSYEEISPNGIFPLQRAAIIAKNYIKTNISEFLTGSTKSLAVAMVTGDKSLLDRDLKNDFKRSGIMHMTAVSGLHMEILSQAFLYILFLIKFNKRFSGILAIPFIWAYAFICGFSPATFRSALMISVTLIGNAVFRKSDSLNSLGLAALLSILINPYIILNVGFELSYSAVLGIICLTPKLMNYFSSRYPVFVKYYGKVLFCSISAWAFTLPISVLKFGYFSNLSCLTNVLTAPFIPIFLTSSFFIGILPSFAVLSPLKFILKLVSKISGAVIIYISQKVSSLPFAVWEINESFEYIWIILSVVLFFIALTKFQKISVRITFLLCSLLIFTAGKATSLFINNGSADIISYEDFTVLTFGKNAVVFDISECKSENLGKFSAVSNNKSVSLAAVNADVIPEFTVLREIVDKKDVETLFINKDDFKEKFLQNGKFKEIKELKPFKYEFSPHINIAYCAEGYYKIKINDIFILKKTRECDIIDNSDCYDIVIDEFGNIFFNNPKINNVFSESNGKGNHIKIYRSNFS